MMWEEILRKKYVSEKAAKCECTEKESTKINLLIDAYFYDIESSDFCAAKLKIRLMIVVKIMIRVK